ncbi:asparaginase [Phycicoccus sp. Soil802]|uniref:asparaginase n=1 Tax=Phycicoccus sp. Soil802 TaxID=1736414 RepID=UPI0007025F27|nr:asparaginase [Phycicoccus sp. Soil802]KRF28373.1 asparaginase [Phycicoccus sp. Soil802]
MSTPHTLTPPALDLAPVLAHYVRGGFVESAHRASVVATAPDGSHLLALGAVDDPIFPRSSNKPIQTLAMVRAGLRMPPAHLALASASHSGEDFHVAAVREMLASVGLTEGALQNTPDYPVNEEAREGLLRAGGGKLPITQNCSGKHAAMLATCVVNGWDTATYRDPGHPLQQAISQTLAELTGDEITAVAVDGCGAPVMAVTLAGLARAFGRMAAAEPGTPEAEVADAIRGNPAYLGGTGRDVTALIEATPGLIAKDGAESVYAVGLADGRGVAVKVADGYPRAKPVILAAALRRLGVESPALEQLEHSPVLGHGEPVGAIVAVNL